MKTIMIIALMISGVSFGQIGQSKDVAETEVIGIADKGVGLPKLEVVPSDNFFILSYYNLEYPGLREIEQLSFYADPSEQEYLYNFLKGQFKSKDSKTLTIGEDQIIVQKVMGSIRITLTDKNSWFYLSKKQLERLFGRA